MSQSYDFCQTKGETDEKVKDDKELFIFHEDSCGDSPANITNRMSHPQTFSTLDLALMDEDPVDFMVEGIIQPGLNILSGGPKVGKSNLSYCIALAVGNGIRLFGMIETKKSDVLFISFEDGQNAIQKRISAMASHYPPSPSVHVAMEWGRDFDDKKGHLENYLKLNPNTGLVIIDTFALFCANKKKSGYAAEYSNSSDIKKIADKNKIGIIAVHHVTKNIPDDWISALYGTHGAVAAADSILFLERNRGTSQGKLHYTGRNIEEGSINLRFNGPSLVWELDDDSTSDLDLHPERREIYDLLDSAKKPMRLSEIAGALGKSTTNVQNMLLKMIKLNLVIKVRHGVYAAVSKRQNISPNIELTVPVDLMDVVGSAEYRYLWS